MKIVKNLDNIKKVLSHIEANLDQWHQGAWHSKHGHCFAGWAEVFATGEDYKIDQTRLVARIYFGFTKREADYYFNPYRSLDELKTAVLPFFNEQGWGRDGFDRDGFNEQGLDHYGRDRSGHLVSNDYNCDDGFDEQGYDAEGYDRQGYNRQGLDRDGFDRNNEFKLDQRLIQDLIMTTKTRKTGSVISIRSVKHCLNHYFKALESWIKDHVHACLDFNSLNLGLGFGKTTGISGFKYMLSVDLFFLSCWIYFVKIKKSKN